MNLIRKAVPKDPPPLMGDYAAARSSFSWDAVAASLGLSLNGPVNLGALAVSRGGSLVWHGPTREEERLGPAELAAGSARFANALRSLGIGDGDRVVFFLRALPALVTGFLGALRAGAVPCIMGRIRNASAVRNILALSGAKLAVIDAEMRPVLDPIRPSLPELKQVLVHQGGGPPAPGESAWEQAVDAAPDAFKDPPFSGGQPAYLQFSETAMSGALASHRAAFALANSASLALDLRAGDGIVTLAVPGDGLFVPYVLLAPLLLGATTHMFDDPARFMGYGLIKDPIQVWYSAVRALDVVVRTDPSLATLLQTCRHIAVSHPYDVGFIAMTEVSYGSPLHPTWFPRDLGAIQCAEFRSGDIQLGSVGRPLPGVEISLEPGTDLLSVNLGLSAAFEGYWQDPDLMARRVKKGWFVSEQRGRIERDGYAWIVA